MGALHRIVVAAVVAGAASLALTSAEAAAPTTPASAIPVTISADSVRVSSLVYHDTVSVQTATGAKDALELELTDATFDGLVLALPCVPTPVGGLTGRTTASGPVTSARITVYATDVAATIAGTTVRLSSTDPTYPPPPAGTTLVTDGTLDQPTMVSLLTTTASITVPGLRTAATFCTPGAAPALKGRALTEGTAPEAPTSSPAAPTTSEAPAPPATTEPGPAEPAPTEPVPSTPPASTEDPGPAVVPDPSPPAPTP